MKPRLAAALIGLSLLLSLPATAQSATKIKDIAFVRGVRSNQLVGYGLVAGLDGTGDGRRIPFTRQMLANMVNQFGVSFETRQLRAENVAAVMVTAELPPYAREGTRIDAVVSTIGDAESVRGGTLLLTPLRGADNEIYAVAQGAVSIGGFETRARRGGQEKHLTAGLVPGGALVEKEVPSTIVSDEKYLTLCLKRTDFTTAARMAGAINVHFHQICAEAVDGGTVRVGIPPKYLDDRVTFISEMESTLVQPDIPAKVVINERTGTVVVGQEAVITPVAISHGDIRIIVAAPSEEPAEAPTTAEAGTPTEGHVAEIEGANVGAGALQARLELM
jgi:flagellar P-ring protein precursor FlgI